MGLCANKTLLMDIEVWISFNFHISQFFFSFGFFPSILECKVFLHSRVTKKQAGGWMWPRGLQFAKRGCRPSVPWGQETAWPCSALHTRHTITCPSYTWQMWVLHAAISEVRWWWYFLSTLGSHLGFQGALWIMLSVLGKPGCLVTLPIREVILHYSDGRTLAVCCMCEHWKKLLIFPHNL